MKIVITDSGLGGLSVLAELDKMFEEQHFFEEVDLLFVNSLYSSDNGYNSMPNIETKAATFNNALVAIEEKHNPDIILIACNTLSVVYSFTEFSKTGNTKVLGIVEGGVQLFKNNLLNKSDKIILLGTPTTINSDVYTKELTKRGINKKQITSQACPDLETKIQNNPLGKETETAISSFLEKALKNIGEQPETLYVGLCCTHYGYSYSLFEKLLKEKTNSEFKILNPNNTLLNFFRKTYKKRYPNANINVRIISQVPIKQNEKNSLINIFSSISQRTVKALKDYEYVEQFFELGK